MPPAPSVDLQKGYAGMDVEALRSLTAALNAVTTNMAEDRRLLNDIHMRVIRIESNRLDSQVTRLEARMSEMERRQQAVELAQATAGAEKATAVGIAGWFARHAPWIFALIAGATVVLGLGDKGGQ